ncbi:MAG: carbon-nitrogen hydrolase family protein [Paracoccaceae bacterium]
MKTALLQLTSSDNPRENLDVVLSMMAQAKAEGAEFVLTPEVTNCVSMSRTFQSDVLATEDQDTTLVALRAASRELGIHTLIGSLALKTQDPDGRFANRSFLIGPDGKIRGRYDKIHMFDVDIDETETFRESAGYRPGTQAVVADADFGKVGMCVCYDMRFPHLAQSLVEGGAQILTYPAAFSPVTGAAHWHSLLRARAIETGSWVLAPAQTGTHATQHSVVRKTFGHSLAVAPWGEVVLDAGTEPGVYTFDLNMEKVAEARKRVPALQNKRSFDGP